MAAGEFPVIDGVAERAQPHRDAPPAALDRQHRILPAVTDEDRRRVLGSRRQREAGRERDDVAEQSAVDQPERQRIGSAVGKTGNRDARRVDPAGAEHLAERAVEERDILAIILADHVPGAAARVRREDDDAMRLGGIGHDRHRTRGRSAGAVQHDQQRHRPIRRDHPRNAQQAVAAAPAPSGLMPAAGILAGSRPAARSGCLANGGFLSA